MTMTKYGASPEQTAKTASGAPGRLDAKPVKTESLKEKIDREKSKKG